MKKHSLYEYPRTPHLGYKPNVQEGDIVSENHESNIILNNPLLFIEEKVDGANCAIMMDEEGNPIVRNRQHILRKGYVERDTPAKLQFRPIWNWFYENREKFQALNKAFYEPVGVYGEWTLALHGIQYDTLESYFVGFDIWLPSKQYFVRTDEARAALEEIGFSVPPLLKTGEIGSFEELDELVSRKSSFSSTDLVEGLYLKVCDEVKVAHRFKLIRPGYVQGERWNAEKLTKQKLKK